MSRAIHNMLKSEYENRQKNVVDGLMNRTREVYAKIPQLEELEEKIRLAGLQYNRQILLGSSGASSAVSQLSRELEKLKRQKIELLVSHGFSENYLEPQYSCSSCKDTGYVEAGGRWEKCSCYRQEYIRHLYAQANLKLIDSQNFDSFDLKCYPDSPDEKKYGLSISPRQNIQNIRSKCMKFIENFNCPEEKNLFFSGPTGVGKTFMTCCIAREILQKGKTVLYETAPVFFDTISRYKMGANREEDFEDEVYKNIFDVELLIIDDLGTEPVSTSRNAELLNILNIRHARNMSVPCKTIISTNLDGRQFTELYTDRVSSRIIGHFERFIFIGEDIRRLKRA